jgi:hypothetical protein
MKNVGGKACRPRGRPPVSLATGNLLVELRRLTGCGAERLQAGVNRLYRAGALSWLQPISVATANRAFRETGWRPAPRPALSQGVLPGWCATHVVPVRLATGQLCDLALVWEPFSYALLGSVGVSFAKPGGLAGVVAKALRKLPLPLEERITSFQVTLPRASETPHWTVSQAARGAAFGRSEFLRDGRTIVFQNDACTGPIQEIAVAFETTRGMEDALATALDAHNLDAVKASQWPSMVPRQVTVPWTNRNGPQFADYFWRKGGTAWSPERRLSEALSVFEADGGAWQHSPLIRRRLSYRS